MLPKSKQLNRIKQLLYLTPALLDLCGPGIKFSHKLKESFFPAQMQAQNGNLNLLQNALYKQN